MWERKRDDTQSQIEYGVYSRRENSKCWVDWCPIKKSSRVIVVWKGVLKRSLAKEKEGRRSREVVMLND